MRLKLTSIIASMLMATTAMAQGAHDFKINEVYVTNPANTSVAGLQDEYGEQASWIEITNTSYTTHDIRSCYLTTDRRALNKEMSAPERIALMSKIPAGDVRTSLGAKQRIVFFADGHQNRGTLHTNFVLKAGEENFIALFDGNGIDLLDSITVPVLADGTSYARILDKTTHAFTWVVASTDQVTPGAPNDVDGATDDKVAEFKREDPHGIAMTIMSMGIVFLCLLLLYIFFHVVGWCFSHWDKLAKTRPAEAITNKANKVVVMAKEGTTETKGIEMENYVAAITLAMHEYYGNMHDMESGVLTIRQTNSHWADPSKEMRSEPIHHQAVKVEN